MSGPVTQSEKAFLPREEWRMLEQNHAEIPMSRLSVGERRDDFVSTIVDDRRHGEEGFFDPLKMIESVADPESDPSDPLRSSRLIRTIMRIADQPKCLTPLRRRVLKLWLQGKSKREIAKILYPERASQIDRGGRTVGVEVYVQYMINHYIPTAIRSYVEGRWPWIVHRILGCLPVHPTFVKRAWADAVRAVDDRGEDVTITAVTDEFLSVYGGNPDAVLTMVRALRADTRESIEVDGAFYNSLGASRIVARMFWDVERVADRPGFASAVLFDDGEPVRSCVGTALYIMLCAAVARA